MVVFHGNYSTSFPCDFLQKTDSQRKCSQSSNQKQGTAHYSYPWVYSDPPLYKDHLKNYSSFYDSNPEATVTETTRHNKADIEIDEEDDLEDAMVPTRPEIHTSRALHCPN